MEMLGVYIEILGLGLDLPCFLEVRQFNQVYVLRNILLLFLYTHVKVKDKVTYLQHGRLHLYVSTINHRLLVVSKVLLSLAC
jgi:hypothetical protein